VQRSATRETTPHPSAPVPSNIGMECGFSATHPLNCQLSIIKNTAFRAAMLQKKLNQMKKMKKMFTFAAEKT
jgi:hypothetical protein